MTQITENLTEISEEEWETDAWDFTNQAKLVAGEFVSPIFTDNPMGYVIRFLNVQKMKNISFVFDNPDSITVGLWLDNPNNPFFNQEQYKFRGYVFKDCKIACRGKDEVIVIEILPYADAQATQRIFIKNPKMATLVI